MVWVQIPARADIWFKIFCSICTPGQLSYDEHTDRILSVEDGRAKERTGHPSSYAVAKKNEVVDTSYTKAASGLA